MASETAVKVAKREYLFSTQIARRLPRDSIIFCHFLFSDLFSLQEAPEDDETEFFADDEMKLPTNSLSL